MMLDCDRVNAPIVSNYNTSILLSAEAHSYPELLWLHLLSIPYFLFQNERAASYL